MTSPAAPADGTVWVTRLRSARADETIAGTRSAEVAAAGGALVLLANVQDQLLGHTPTWGSVEVATYASPAAVPPVDDDGSPTLVVTARPLPVPALPDDAPTWDEVPHPPTAEDPAVLVLHVIRFHEGGAQGDMVSYQDEAGQVAVPHGVRLDGWLGVDEVLAGDGRTWDQVRFNAFPSREAFMAVVFDPARLAAQRDHREVAIADTYTLVLRPILNDLAASIG